MKNEELEVNNGLPNGWIETIIDNLGEVVSGGTPSTKDSENFGGFISWITPADLTNYKNKYISKGKRNITIKGLKSSSARLMPKGSILFSSRAPIGYTVIALNKVCTNQGFKSLIPCKEHIDSEYIYFYLKNSKHLAESFASGTTFKEISNSSFKKLPIKLPPLNEQKRIVEKIEKLFSNLDNSDKYLLHLEKQLKRYRQSVLKSAFEGELTKEWRNINKFSYDDWKNQTILEIADKIFAGGDKPDKVSDTKTEEYPYPIYSNGLQDKGLYGYTNIYKVEEECITISARGTIGFPLVRNERFVPIVRLIVVIPKDYIFSKYLKYYLESKIVVQSGSSIPQLTVPMVKQIEILVPQLEEQQEIVNQIEKHFSIIDKLENVVQKSINESKRLRQSILKQAFEGKLVEQDPNDESASILLEKIAKAKEEYLKAQKKQVRKK